MTEETQMPDTESTVTDVPAPEQSIDDVAVLADLYAAGDQFQRDVAAEFAAMGVSADDPQWVDWCAQMDAWIAASASAY